MSKKNRPTITVDGKDFYIDELDNNQLYHLKQVQSLRARIEEARFNLAQLHAAEVTFSSSLSASMKSE